MASSILRWISRKVTTAARSPPNSPPWPKSPRKNCVKLQIGPDSIWMSSFPQKTVLPSRISLWLMLPPAVVEGGFPNNNNNNMVYMFYSVAEDTVIGLSKIRGSRGGGEVPDDDVEFVGLSHGWIASINRRNCDLFLSSPLSGCHVKLPPIHTLPIPQSNLKGGYGCVNKLIISCSPVVEDRYAIDKCRAMMSFGPTDRLAFCCPGRSTEWTPIGEPFDYGRRKARKYESFVYSSVDECFLCLTENGEFESWDLRNPKSPMLSPMDVSMNQVGYPWAARLAEDDQHKLRMFSFLVNSSWGRLYLVRRHVMEHLTPDGSDKCPYKTIGFDVHRYYPRQRELKYVNSSLDGLAMFIGKNHSFAVRASNFPELKPNSIYYTDTQPRGHDIGIFNHEDGTFSSCYYPLDVTSFPRIIPAPMWFTPTPI